MSRLSQAGRLSHKRVVSIRLTTLFGRNSQFIYHETSFPSTRHRKYVYRYTPSSSVFIYREMSTLLDYLLGLYLPPFPSLSICLLPRDRPATFALLFASLISTRLRLVSSPFYRSISSFLLTFFSAPPLSLLFYSYPFLLISLLSLLRVRCFLCCCHYIFALSCSFLYFFSFFFYLRCLSSCVCSLIRASLFSFLCLMFIPFFLYLLSSPSLCILFLFFFSSPFLCIVFASFFFLP